jgi:hypothetical protein
MILTMTTPNVLTTSHRPLRDINYAAERLSLTVDQTYYYCRNNVVPHVRLGRQIKFDETFLEDFIRAGGLISYNSKVVKN